MPWECEVRVGTVDKQLLETMQKAGCYYLDIGIESGSQRILEKMNKGIMINDAEKLLKWCQELGLRTKCFFTVGHIGETVKEGMETIRFIQRNRKHITLVGYNPGIRIYPGTLLNNLPKRISCYLKDFHGINHMKIGTILKFTGLLTTFLFYFNRVWD